jgi:hypothetical protein
MEWVVLVVDVVAVVAVVVDVRRRLGRDSTRDYMGNGNVFVGSSSDPAKTAAAE